MVSPSLTVPPLVDARVLALLNLSLRYSYTWSKYIENNNGLHGHPCLTPFKTGIS